MTSLSRGAERNRQRQIEKEKWRGRREGEKKRESERPRLSAVSSDYPSLSTHPQSSNDSSSSNVNIHRIRDTQKPSETIPSLQQLSPHAQHSPFHLILHKTKALKQAGGIWNLCIITAIQNESICFLFPSITYTCQHPTERTH